MALAAAPLLGCADAERIEPPAAAAAADHTVSFVGFAYDGVSGDRLTGYALTLEVADTQSDGTVADSGRYNAGPISVWDDFTVVIGRGDDYRDFRSHNARIGLPPELAQSDDIADIASHQTLHFDAYLFPASLEAPAVTFTIETPAGTPPSGSIRLRPIGPSILAGSDDTPAGVPDQVWVNDEDLQGGVLSADFSGGTFTIDAGTLIYGVQYGVDIYGVSGHQPLAATYAAGIETNKTFTLEEEVAEPLVVTDSSVETCTPPGSPTDTSGAIVTIQFNHPIELAASAYPGGPVEALDDGISIVSTDSQGDGVLLNTLYADMLDNTQERGVTATATNNTLTISWNPNLGLETKDPDDPIDQVTYAGLANVQIQRMGSPSSAATLSTLLGQATIVCD